MAHPALCCAITHYVANLLGLILLILLIVAVVIPVQQPHLPFPPCTNPCAAKAELDSTLLTFALRTPRTCYTVLVLANKQDIAGALAPAKLERALDISSR